MAGVIGPNSYLPGQKIKVPQGAMCDDHPDRAAVARIVGETDSFGSELIDACQECMDKIDNIDLTYDWEALRAQVIENKGIRNSFLVAYMPGESSKANIGSMKSSISIAAPTLMIHHIPTRTPTLKSTLEMTMSDAQKKYLTTPEGTARLQKNIEKISRKVTIDGVDYPSILEASRTLGIPYTTLVRKYNL